MKALTLTPSHIEVFWKIFPVCLKKNVIINYLDETGKRDISLNPYYFFIGIGPEFYLWAEHTDGSMGSYALYGIMNVIENNSLFAPDENKIDSRHNKLDTHYALAFMPAPLFNPRIKETLKELNSEPSAIHP